MTRKPMLGLLCLAMVLLAAFPVAGTGRQEAKAAPAAAVNPTGFPVVNTPITITMMGSRAPIQADWNKLTLWDWYEKKTNIHVNWLTVDDAAREEKKKLLFASGDLPETFYGFYLSAQDEIVLGSQGVLMPLEKLYDKWAPNVTKYLNSSKEIRNTYTAPDGHIYTFPSGTDRTVFLVAYTCINNAWLQKLGIPMPATTDEFYQTLKAFKEKDPNGNGKADEIPLSLMFTAAENDFWPLTEWFGITATDKVRVYADDDGKVVYVPTDARTRKAVLWFNKLWKEGLLDKEAFTQTWQQVDAKGMNKDAELLGVFLRSTIAWTVGFDRWPHYQIMPALKNDLGTTVVTGTTVQSKGRFSLTSRNKNPEATVRWVDYFATVEGSMNVQLGPEGTGWKWNGDGTFSRIPKPTTVQSETVTPKNGTFVPFINFNQIVSTEKLAAGDPGYQLPVYSGIDKWLYPYRRVNFPDAYMTADQVKATSSIEADTKANVDQMIARFIVGDAPISEWDNYVATVNKMGIDRLLKTYQEVYDAFNKK